LIIEVKNLTKIRRIYSSRWYIFFCWWRINFFIFYL